MTHHLQHTTIYTHHYNIKHTNHQTIHRNNITPTNHSKKGYPIVDAAMRQIWSTGWCHNRARVVAASFLVKHLLLPWQWGLKHLWDCQIDADLECDALGRQYVAGCLADAHPFGRMVDLEAEAKRREGKIPTAPPPGQ